MLLSAALLTGALIPVRTAKVDLTPNWPVPLGGYTDRKGAVMEPGGERLWARAVDVAGVTIVALDQLTVPQGFAEAVAQRVGGAPPILVATHTHCAPDSQMLNPRMTFAVPGIAAFNARWSAWALGRVSEAVAWARQAPPTWVRDLTLRRASVRLNKPRRPGAKPDTTAWLLEADGRPVLASYPAHATFHEEDWNKTDGDWPGRLAERLGCPVVPGAIGDVAPAAVGSTPVEKCRCFVDKFVRALDWAEPEAVCTTPASVQAWAVPWALGGPAPHPSFSATYGVPDALSQVLVGRFAESQAHVQIVRFGDLVVVGVPGEPTAALGRRIEQAARLAGFPHCLVLSHVNGWVGYVLEPEDYDRGGYEATLSFNGRDTGERLLDAARAGLSVRPGRSSPGHGSSTAGSSGRTRSF